MRAFLLFASAGALVALAAPARAEKPPRLELSLGLDHRTLGGDSTAFDRLHKLRETVGGAGALQASAAGAGQRPSAQVTALDLRTTGDLAPHFYSGLELSMGRVKLRDPSLDRAGISVRRGLYYAAGGVGGLSAAAGPLRVRAELLAGVQAVHLGVEVERTGREMISQAIEPMLEPRLAAELSLGSLSLGARAGSNLLRRGDFLFGLYLALSWPA